MTHTVKIDVALKHLIPNYLRSLKNETALAESYLIKTDFESIQTIAHDWIGVASGYGFTELGIIGQHLETVCIVKNTIEIMNQIQLAKIYLDSIKIEYIIL